MPHAPCAVPSAPIAESRVGNTRENPQIDAVGFTGKMWRKLKEIVLNFSTYTDLSPDVEARRQVNQALRDRQALNLEQWFEFFWRPRGMTRPVVTFVYTYLEKYSGLQIGRVRPCDRLEQDLQLTLVCWFDWQMSLCEDFLGCFGVDISERVDLSALSTVEEFVRFLNHQILAIKQT
jgi:hypothetical protein